ncbi:MAG: DUF3341 domain-containing protein [Bryobacteraceae bacterium]
MIEKLTPVFGIFYDKAQAERSVDRLLASGIANETISMLAPGDLGLKDLAHDRDERAGSSTAVVTSSVAVGGTLGLLAGIGALAIPGIGPLIAAGPFMGALAGFGAGGTVGGLIDALDAAGLPEPEAKRYEGHIKEGGILLSVHCDTSDAITRAKELLKETGAQAIWSPDEIGGGPVVS